MAGHLYTYGRVLGIEELIDRVEAVDAAALRRFAEQLCRRGDPAIAAVGPVKRLEAREAFAHRFGRGPPLSDAQWSMFTRGMMFPGGREPILPGDSVLLRFPPMS